MAAGYVGAFNATTDDHWRDPGSYTGTYIGLIATVAFFPLLWLLLTFIAFVYDIFARCCCKKDLSQSWLLRLGMDSQTWFGPVLVRINLPLSAPKSLTTLILPIFTHQQCEF